MHSMLLFNTDFIQYIKMEWYCHKVSIHRRAFSYLKKSISNDKQTITGELVLWRSATLTMLQCFCVPGRADGQLMVKKDFPPVTDSQRQNGKTDRSPR